MHSFLLCSTNHVEDRLYNTQGSGSVELIELMFSVIKCNQEMQSVCHVKLPTNLFHQFSRQTTDGTIASAWMAVECQYLVMITHINGTDNLYYPFTSSQMTFAWTTIFAWEPQPKRRLPLSLKSNIMELFNELQPFPVKITTIVRLCLNVPWLSLVPPDRWGKSNADSFTHWPRPESI